MQSTLGAARILDPPADSTLVLVHVDEFCCDGAVRNRDPIDLYLANVLQRIEEAKQANRAIVPAVLMRFTEPDKAVYAILRDQPIPESIKIPGVLHPAVVAALKEYDRCPKEALQTRSDASPEIERCCREHGYPTAAFDLVGMYLEYCVWSSAGGLHGRYSASKIRVLWESCLPFNTRECWGIYESPNSAGIDLVPARSPALQMGRTPVKS